MSQTSDAQIENMGSATPLLGSQGASNYQTLILQKLTEMESNWEKESIAQIHLPHPSHPEEAHTEAVYSIKYRGNRLVSCGRDCSIRIWDVDTQRLVTAPLLGHVGSVLTIQFDASEEQDVLFSAGIDGNVIVWKLSTGERLHTIEKAHMESVLSLQFDENYLVTGSKDRTIKVWCRNQILPGEKEISWVKASDGHGDESLLPFTKIREFTLHQAAVNAVCMLNDEIVSGSGDRVIRVWSIEQGECVLHIPNAHSKGVVAVQYDGKSIFSASSDNTIGIFDRSTGFKVAHLEGHNNLVRSLQVALPVHLGNTSQKMNDGLLDNRFFRIGDTWQAVKIVSGSYDGDVIVWKRDTDGNWFKSRVFGRRNLTDRVFSVQFDLRYLFYSTMDGQIQGYDFANGDGEIMRDVTSSGS